MGRPWSSGGIGREHRGPGAGLRQRTAGPVDRGPDLECRMTLLHRDRNGSRRPWSCAPLARSTGDVVDAFEERCHGSRSSPAAWAWAIAANAGGLVMPATVFYHPEEDWGLSLLADFALSTRGFEVWTSSLAPHGWWHAGLTCGSNRAGRSRSLILLPSGRLAARLGSLECYPEFFRVADSRIPQLHGPFVCSGGTPRRQDARPVAGPARADRRGARNAAVLRQHLPWASRDRLRRRSVAPLAATARPGEARRRRLVEGDPRLRQPQVAGADSVAQINDYVVAG